MEPDPSDSTANATRKMKYAPKAPLRRAPKPEIKTEMVEKDDAAQAMDLLQRITKLGALKGRPKVDKKVAPSKIAFGQGGASTSIKSYGVPKGGVYASATTHEKEYQEPWDYYSNYPVTLPLRRPYSGSPEILDEEEFGVASETLNYDESSINLAEELGLMEESLEPNMFFLQLPPTLPMKKLSATAGERQVTERPSTHENAVAKEKTSNLNELPGGFMGKLLVYRSGAVKLKLGDTLYDVTPGVDCMFAQDIVAINATEKHCCVVGELNKRAIVTPDIDFVLNNFTDF